MSMSKEEAIEYCYLHQDEFMKDAYDSGEDGQEQFDSLVSCLESGHIKPEELADYGMNY